jgi:uncharacterized protein (DUF433 family)
MTMDMLKPSEAAVVANVALRDVHRVIDERILPDNLFSTDDGRHVHFFACFLIDFYFHSASSLTSEERMLAISEASSRLNKPAVLTWAKLLEKDWTVRDDFLVIDLLSFVKRSKERMDRLIAARNLVISDPEILGGTPVIRGTRIPVHDVAASVEAGIPKDRILASYPGLDKEKVELAKIYAEANPPRGRPRSQSPKGIVTLADRRAPRRRKVG